MAGDNVDDFKVSLSMVKLSGGHAGGGGDSFVIHMWPVEAGERRGTVLVDAGDGVRSHRALNPKHDANTFRITSALMSGGSGATDLDLVVITHNHTDHANGAFSLLQWLWKHKKRIENVWFNTSFAFGEPADSELGMSLDLCPWLLLIARRINRGLCDPFRRDVRDIDPEDTNFVTAEHQLTLRYGAGGAGKARFVVLSPLPTVADLESLVKGMSRKANHNSIVFTVEFSETLDPPLRMLFTGDADTLVFEQIPDLLGPGHDTSTGITIRTFDVVKVPHHGSKEGTCLRSYLRLAADYYLISCSGTEASNGSNTFPDPGTIGDIAYGAWFRSMLGGVRTGDGKARSLLARRSRKECRIICTQLDDDVVISLARKLVACSEQFEDLRQVCEALRVVKKSMSIRDLNGASDEEKNEMRDERRETKEAFYSALEMVVDNSMRSKDFRSTVANARELTRKLWKRAVDCGWSGGEADALDDVNWRGLNPYITPAPVSLWVLKSGQEIEEEREEEGKEKGEEEGEEDLEEGEEDLEEGEVLVLVLEWTPANLTDIESQITRVWP